MRVNDVLRIRDQNKQDIISVELFAVQVNLGTIIGYLREGKIIQAYEQAQYGEENLRAVIKKIKEEL